MSIRSKKGESDKTFLNRQMIKSETEEDDIIKKFDDFEEDYEEFDFEQTPDYEFLKNLYDFLSKKSHPKKCTRRFLRYAQDFIKKDEVSQKSLDQFIEAENINKDIVKEMERKFKKEGTKTTNNNGGIGGVPGCGGGGNSRC